MSQRRGPKTSIKMALRTVSAEIGGLARGGHIAAGLSGEGYAGGYRDALSDVLLLLAGTLPNRRNYWKDLSTSADEQRDMGLLPNRAGDRDYQFRKKLARREPL